MPDDEDDVDPTMRELMQENFGPPDGAPATDRIERGLSKMQELSMSEAGDRSLHWLHEGSCVGDDVEPLGPRVCFRCGKPAPPASCAQCGVAAYCNQECQKADWGKKGAFGGHKIACPGYKMLGRAQQLPITEQKTTFERLLASLRLRMCPFALCQFGLRGRGLVLIQSDCTLAQLALPTPRDCSGRIVPRSVVLQFLDVEEMDEMVRRISKSLPSP